MTNSLCPLPRPPTEGALTTGWNALLLLGGTVDDACIWKNYHKIIHHIHCTCVSQFSVLEKLNNYLYMYISVHVFKMYKVNVVQYLLLKVHYPSQGLTLGSLIG